MEALNRRVYTIDLRDEGLTWRWWIRHNELELSDMTEEEIEK